MTDNNDASEISRRGFLAGATSLLGGALAGAGLRGAFVDAAGPERGPAALAALYHGLSADQRRHICVPLHHPSRQLTNTSLIAKRPHVRELLGPEQRARLSRIADATLSQHGRLRYGPLLGRDCGGTDACVLLIYGQPHEPGFHAMLNGGHLLLRTAEASSAGVLFGGPIAYGHQRGDFQYRVPGNAFAFQSDAANAFYATLTTAQRALARVAIAPHELQVQLQGSAGEFEGLRIEHAGERAVVAAHAWVDSVLSSFEPGRARALWSALERNGGVAGMHAAFYEDGAYYPDRAPYARVASAERARRGEPYFQRWRLEGPAAVIHFNGAPHVHAYLHIAQDAADQYAGAQLALAERPLGTPELVHLLANAMRAATGEAYGFFPLSDVSARIGRGPVTEGTLWSLDPYENPLCVVEVRGAALQAPARLQLQAQGAVVSASARYRIATTAYAARRGALGRAERVEPRAELLRDALVQQVTRHGLPNTVAS